MNQFNEGRMGGRNLYEAGAERAEGRGRTQSLASLQSVGFC